MTGVIRGLPETTGLGRNQPLCRREWLTTGDLAKLFKVATRTVKVWCDRDLIPSRKLPGSRDRRIRRADAITFGREYGWPVPVADVVVWIGGGPEGVVGTRPLSAPDGFHAALLIRDESPAVVVVDVAAIGRTQAIAIGRRLGAEKFRPLTVVVVTEDDDGSSWDAAEWDVVVTHPRSEVAAVVRRLLENGA